MKKAQLIATIFILCIGCSANVSRSPGKFVEFLNHNKIEGNEDGYTIKDRYFKIFIPRGMKGGKLEAGGSFIQILQFAKNETIVLLYIPEDKPARRIKSLDLSCDDFVTLLKKETIADLLIDIHLDQNKHFGLYKPDQKRFYVMYLNIDSDRVKTFNYSIGSIQFPPRPGSAN